MLFSSLIRSYYNQHRWPNRKNSFQDPPPSLMETSPASRSDKETSTITTATAHFSTKVLPTALHRLSEQSGRPSHFFVSACIHCDTNLCSKCHNSIGLQRRLQEQRNISDDRFKSRTNNIHRQEGIAASGYAVTADVAYTCSSSSALQLTAGDS